jgi:ATP-dependent Lon protease
MKKDKEQFELNKLIENNDRYETFKFPVIPLRNEFIFPDISTPILVGRIFSVNALHEVEKNALGHDEIVVVSQKNNILSDDDPFAKDLYRVGTLCTVLQKLKLPDGNYKVLLQGKERIKIKHYYRLDKMLKARISLYPKTKPQITDEVEATFRSLVKLFITYVKSNSNIPDEILIPINVLSMNKKYIIYYILTNLAIDIHKKQKIYAENDIFKTATILVKELTSENQILKLEKKIETQVKQQLSKSQKEYFLHEQLKVIHKELGYAEEEKSEFIDLKKQIDETNLSEEARKKAKEEIKKLSRMNHNFQEYNVLYTYLTTMLKLPWNNPEKKDIEIREAKNVLDSDHYGLEKIKDRILEFLSIIKLTSKVKGQILCFVGPPGVGKTSLGKSIAAATGREFVRLSLGGVRDEAEIRGHRRTYVGALPGIIINGLIKAGTKNPLIMMDEVDKMSVDFRGDPSAALLEVLDPEQNNDFRDHYLDFGFDLSDVLFITTANSLSEIPQPLYDRMEVIELPGYTEFEKLKIAEKHLIPKILGKYEVKNILDIIFESDAVSKIIQSYTREAGVRSLERKLSSIVRKIVKKYFEEEISKKVVVNTKMVSELLGVEKHLYSEVNNEDKIGVVTGLAWTASGGDTLQIQVVKMKGNGKLKLTGNLGDVMQESAEAAFSYARTNAEKLGIDPDFYKEYDLHLHVPEGGVPKDGPSAGITITSAIISCLSDKKVDAKIAMTGEITLCGDVLPIGGLAEKLIAAKRAGKSVVIFPSLNLPNVSEIKDEIKKDIELIPVKHISEVLKLILK